MAHNMRPVQAVKFFSNVHNSMFAKAGEAEEIFHAFGTDTG